MTLRQQDELDEQIVRIRAVVAKSMASIARSEERIGESMRLLAHSRRGFEAQEAKLTDEELIDAARYHHQQEQQGEIDREVSSTVEAQPVRSRS